MESIGETGEGGFAYPAIQKYIRRCSLVIHQVGSTLEADGGEGVENSSCGDDSYGNNKTVEKEKEFGGQGGQSDEGWANLVQDNEEDGDCYRFRRPIRDGVLNFGINITGMTGGGGKEVIRSRCPPLFIRAPVYFSELLALGRFLHAIDREGHTGSAMAADRGRIEAVAYCLTLVRMCCASDSGGLEKAEPAEWVIGGRQIDEDTATLQRSQLLVDVRLPEKLAPCLHDRRSEVRRDAANCALSALRGGHEYLRWASPVFGEGAGVDPRALLALGFCTPVWVSGFVGIIRGQGGGASGSATPGRAARQTEASLKSIALRCLGYMAVVGDLATQSWQPVRAIAALQGALSRANAGNDASAMPGQTVNGSGGCSGWREGILDVLRALAENGSGTTHAMLRDHPGICELCRIPEMNLLDTLTSKGVAARAAELLQGGTLHEVISLIRRVRSVLGTAVRLGDYRVLGSSDADDIPEDIGLTSSLVWGWMQRTVVQLTRDSPEHPSTKARISLAQECIGLMRFLLTSKSLTAFRLVHCRIHPALVREVSLVSGASTPEDTPHQSDFGKLQREGSNSKLELAEARTGLDVIVYLFSSHESVPLDFHRAHPIPPLAAGAADALADAVTYGDRSTIDFLDRRGLGYRFALAVENAAKFAKASRRYGVEFIHLVGTYPCGRQARTRLLDRVLWRAHRGLLEQMVISGLIEFIVSNMLPDCTPTDIVNARLPASFVRYNGTPLVRNEGLALLEKIVARRRRCPAIASETARQMIRHELPSAEVARLRKHRHGPIRAGVGTALKVLAQLGSAPVDRALTLTGVPKQAITDTRRDPMNKKTRTRWIRWLRREAEASPSSPGQLYSQPMALRDVPQPLPFRRSPAYKSVNHEVFSRHNDEVTGNQTDGLSRSPQSAAMELLRTNLPLDDKVVKPKFPWINTVTGDVNPLHDQLTVDKNELRSEQTPRTILGPVPATNEPMIRAILTIEGDISTLSTSDLAVLLATELGTTEENFGVIEAVGSTTADTPILFSLATGIDSPVHTQSTVAGSTVKLFVAKSLGEALYTRCLAGVLRIPGLLHLEVRGDFVSFPSSAP